MQYYDAKNSDDPDIRRLSQATIDQERENSPGPDSDPKLPDKETAEAPRGVAEDEIDKFKNGDFSDLANLWKDQWLL
eukprot:5917066-Pyramimonas_sp.AAC.1